MPRKGEKAPWLKNVTAHTRPARGMGTNLPASGKIWDEGKPAKAFSADHQPPPGAQEAGKADAARRCGNYSAHTSAAWPTRICGLWTTLRRHTWPSLPPQTPLPIGWRGRWRRPAA
jgi:hypothetical protein